MADDNWRRMPLGEFVMLQRGHDLPEERRRSGNVPILGSFGITGWHDEAKTRGPGVTVGRSGASFGAVCYSSVDYWPLNTALYVIDFHGNDPRFSYYFLKSLDFQSFNSGSAQPSLNRNFIHPMPVDIPPLGEQRAIAHILGTLDDKIELNRRMNETLEAMARALFKSWFVDFDPVRAKVERINPKLPSPLAELFPSEFEESELGKIPIGWRVSTLARVTTKIGSGATPRGGSSVYTDDGVALIRSQNVYDSQFIWDGLARITDAAAIALQGVTVEREDILLNITGASILRTCIVEPHVLPARVNQHVCIIRALPEVPARYIHFHLLQPSTKALLLGMDAGASRQAVTKQHIESVPLIVPSHGILDKFANLTGALFRSIDNNNSQSRTLAALRDTLLPKLISGELRVKTAEKIVEAVA